MTRIIPFTPNRWSRPIRFAFVAAIAATRSAPDLGALATNAAGVRYADTVLIDSFDSLTQWRTNPSEGVEISIHPDDGAHGRAMRIDFDFHGRQGYWIVHRELDLKLPLNYQFKFALRGQAPANNLEFKLVDQDHASVWWSKQPDFNFPHDWQTLTRSRREICYAWGGQARRNYETRRLSAIEFAISTGTGGKGSVWIDDLTLTPLDLESPFTFTAPVASNPLVGTWETEATSKGVSGAKLDFEADGSFRSIVGLMAIFAYRVDKDRLTTVLGDANTPDYTFTNSFRISNDAFLQSGNSLLGRDVAMKRIGKRPSASDIRGAWAFEDSTAGTTFVAFGENATAELRIPERTCSGTWRESAPGRIVVTQNGEITERDYSIENDVLTVKDQGRDFKYHRRTRTP